MNEEIITPDEVAALNAARTALSAIADRNYKTVLQGTATVAEYAVFSVLNHADSFLGAGLTAEELHNTTAEFLA